MEVHHGDVLEFDIKKLCDPHVDRKAWEEGKKRLMGKFQKKKNTPEVLTFTRLVKVTYFVVSNVSHYPWKSLIGTSKIVIIKWKVLCFVYK